MGKLKWALKSEEDKNRELPLWLVRSCATL